MHKWLRPGITWKKISVSLICIAVEINEDNPNERKTEAINPEFAVRKESATVTWQWESFIVEKEMTSGMFLLDVVGKGKLKAG